MDEVVSIAAKRGASGTKQKVRPRTKPPEVRREEIMDAAQSLFLKQGVGPTTIDHAASAADVAKATVYLHFTSKQDLLVVLGAQFAEKRLAHIEAAIPAESGQDWTGKLAAWAEACVGFHLDTIELHDMLLREARAPTREGLADNVIIDHLEALLRAGHAAGVWSIDDPRHARV
jgi:AcrR family transcriptional regulator